MIIEVANRLKTVEDYYFVKKLEEIRKLDSEGHQVINFGIGNPDMAPSENTIETLISSAKNSHNHGYQPYRGAPELREQIAKWYFNQYNVFLNPASEVLPLMGSKEGILHISMAFLNPGDKALVPNPGYPTYSSLTKLIGAEIEYYDLKETTDWYPDLEELAKKDLSKVKIMWINYPHMPTGAPANIEKLSKIVEFAKEHKILLCHDNPYSLVLNTDKPISIFNIPGAMEVAIELNSLSKSFNMAGWRVGMLTGKAEYLAAVVRVKSNIDSGMFLPLQKAAIEALQNDEKWHQMRNNVYAERRKGILKIVDFLGCTYDKNQMGLFIWAKAPDTILDIPQWLTDILYKTYVFITPGIIFGSNGERFIRFSLCVPEDKINEAYIRLQKL